MALEFAGDDGTHLPVFGRLTERPPSSADDREGLRAGLPTDRERCTATSDPRAPSCFAAWSTAGSRGTLVGEVSPEFLWGSLASSMPSPTTMVSVVDDSGHVLFRSTQAELVSQSDPINEAAPVADPRRGAAPGRFGGAAVRLVRLADPARRGVRRPRPGRSC